MNKHSGAIFAVVMSLAIYGILKPIMPDAALWPCFTLMFVFFVSPVLFFDFIAHVMYLKHQAIKGDK